jgi:hypothetical protein
VNRIGFFLLRSKDPYSCEVLSQQLEICISGRHPAFGVLSVFHLFAPANKFASLPN